MCSIASLCGLKEDIRITQPFILEFNVVEYTTITVYLSVEVNARKVTYGEKRGERMLHETLCIPEERMVKT